MASSFQTFDGLVESLSRATFDRPPAIVCNAHITALGVARALSRRDVPVIALDRTGDGVAPPSTAVDFAGRVTYPLDDRDGFRADIEAVAEATGHEPVVFPCMDEWAHSLAASEPEGVILPFASFDVVDSVLNKATLYERASSMGVPVPRTYRLDESDPDEVATELGFPLVLKPELKRLFEEAFGTNLVFVESREEYDATLERAGTEGISMLAQEAVPKSAGDLYTLASYVPQRGVEGAVTFVGNRRAVYPPEFGTTCLVERAHAPEIEEYALAVLDDVGYYGISESEFLYDARRDDYLLLDVNTRPWKWIGLPVQAGANLPMAAYADETGGEYESGSTRDATWVYLKDYAALLANHSRRDELAAEDWLSLVSGEFESRPDLTTAVYAPSDPAPFYRLLETEFGGDEYYCAC